jgi:hypothetical protein
LYDALIIHCVAYIVAEPILSEIGPIGFTIKQCPSLMSCELNICLDYDNLNDLERNCHYCKLKNDEIKGLVSQDFGTLF